MPDVDIYGDILDADTIETAVRTTLQTWIVPHLAHQERRRSLPPRSLPPPRSWPTVSDFNIEAHNTLPALVLISPGTSETEHDRGRYRTTWRIEAAAVVAGKDEPEARLVASLYLAALKGALIQNPTLGGAVELCRWIGPDDHAFGTTQKGGQRAIYGTAFAVTARDAVNVRQGPDEPPEDPYAVPEAPEYPNVSEFTVEAELPQETL